MLETLRSVLNFRRLEFDGVARRLSRGINVDELRSIAQRRLPAGVFDYIDGGAGERGVTHVLNLPTDDVRRTMHLIGTATVADITSDSLMPR